jgi:hypothetical protein
MGDRALTDVNHRMRAVRAQPGHAVWPHRELHTRPPAKARTLRPRRGALLIAGQGLNRDLTVEAG